MYRLRVSYGKLGKLRFLGHLEVCGALERAVRRARLPIAYGQGFHPKAKLAFGPALPVGSAGRREYVDLTLTEYVAPADAVEALRAGLPEGMPAAEAKYVGTGAPSLAAAAAVAVYEVEMVGLGVEHAPAVEAGLKRLSVTECITVQRRGSPRSYVLADALARPVRVADGREAITLIEWLAIKDQAPVRPEAIAAEVTAGIETVHFMRVTRMECYGRRHDELVSLMEST